MDNGKLLQLNKSFKDLKNSQKHKISEWMYVAYKRQIMDILDRLGQALYSIMPMDIFESSRHVEAVVLLSQQKPDEHVRIQIDLDELDETSAETKATYDKIRDWVGDNYQLHVTNLNIAQVKRKNCIELRENYN